MRTTACTFHAAPIQSRECCDDQPGRAKAANDALAGECKGAKDAERPNTHPTSSTKRVDGCAGHGAQTLERAATRTKATGAAKTRTREVGEDDEEDEMDKINEDEEEGRG